jgi:hypothetical protein
LPSDNIRDDRFCELPRCNITDQMAKPLSDELKAAAEKAIMTPLAASKDARLAPAFRRVISMAARIGLEIDPMSDKKLSVVQVDKVLKEAGATIEERFELKTFLAAANPL